MATDGPRLGIWALGGGLGHLQRALALARELPAVVLTTCPQHAAMDHGLDVTALGGRADEVLAAAAGWLRARRLDALVVDALPAGPAGELVQLRDLLPPRVALLARRLVGYEVPAADWPLFSLVVRVEPGAPEVPSPLTVDAGPLLARRRDELPGPGPARARLRLPEGFDGRVLLALHGGYPGEAEALFRLVRGAFEAAPHDGWLLRLACLRRLDDPKLRPLAVSVWPAQDLLPGVVGVVAAGGYHAVHEAALAGVPSVHVPMARRFDDQAARVAATPGCLAARSHEALLGSVRRLLEEPWARPSAGDGLGARRAAEALAAWARRPPGE